MPMFNEEGIKSPVISQTFLCYNAWRVIKMSAEGLLVRRTKYPVMAKKTSRTLLLCQINCFVYAVKVCLCVQNNLMS